MLTFEIDLLLAEARDDAIQALTISQGYLGCPDGRIRALIGRCFSEIPTNQWIAPSALSKMLTFEISLSDSRGEEILVLAVIRGFLCRSAVRTHECTIQHESS